MAGVLNNIHSDDDVRPAYQGAYSADEQAADEAWLNELVGDGAETVTEGQPQNLAPVSSGAEAGNVVAQDPEAEQAAPWWAGEGQPDDASHFLSDSMAEGAAAAGAVGADVLGGIAELPRQALSGVNDALSELDQFLTTYDPIGLGVQLFGEDGFDPKILNREEMLSRVDQDQENSFFSKEANTVTGGLFRSASQFLTGFMPGLSAVKATKIGAKAGGVVSGMAAGALADMVVFDPNEARLSTLLNEIPVLQEVVPDYLAAHGGEEGDFEGRIKNAIEGAGIGLMADGLMKAFKYYKAQRAVKAQQDQGAFSLAQSDQTEAVAKSQIQTDVTDDQLRALGDESEAAPLLIDARPDETIQNALQRRTEAEQRIELSNARNDALARVQEIIEGKKRSAEETGVKPKAEAGIEREPIDDALDELRSGAVSKAKLPARPMSSIVKNLGGIDPSSSLAGDLRSRGITAKSFPGLYKRGGAQSLDNVPASEHQLFVERGLDDGNGYVPQSAFVDALEDELKGNPWRTADEQRVLDDIVAPSQELDEQLSRLGIDYENMSNQAVKERLKQIVDEEEAFRSYQESVVSRIDGQTAARTEADLIGEQREIWSVEQTAEARAAGVDEAIINAHQPNKVYVNLARIKGAEDVKAVIQEMANRDAAYIDQKRRGVVSNEQTIKESSQEYKDLESLIGRAPAPMSAAQAVAARRILASSAEQVVQLAKLASQANAGKVDEYNFRRALSVHAAIQAEVIAARTETARALQSWSIPTGASKARTDAINDLIAREGGGNIKKLANSIMNASDENIIHDIARQSIGAKAGDVLYTVYVNGLLAGPKTHLANAISNSAVAAYAIPERYLAEVFSNAFGRGDIAKGEAGAMMYGMIEGVRDGFRLMLAGSKAQGLDDLKHLHDIFGKMEARTNPISGGAFGLDPSRPMSRGLDIIGKVISAPGTALDRADLFFKALNYRMELNALAFREASLEGLEGQAFSDKMADILKNPPKDLVERSTEMASINTFTNPLGEKGRFIQSAISKTPLRWAIPFVRTPTNIMKYTFERTPLAYLSSGIRADIAAGGARAAQAHARVALGSMMMMSFAGLAIDGVITGGGSLDPKLNAARRLEGWQPYSIKINGTWYSYSRLDPIGMMMGLSSDIAEITNSPSGDADQDFIVAAGVTAVAQNLASKTYMQGLFELSAALDPRNPTGNPGKFMMKTAGGLVPYSAMLRQAAQAIDPYIREVKEPSVREDGSEDKFASFFTQLINTYKKGIPGLSDELPPVRDIFGEPISTVSGVGAPFDMFVPIQAKKEKTDPVARAIIENEVKISKPMNTISGVKLTAEQYDEYQVLAGGLVRQYLDILVSDPGFNNLSSGKDGMKSEMIRRMVFQAQDHARRMMLAKDPELKDRYQSKVSKTKNMLLGN